MTEPHPEDDQQRCEVCGRDESDARLLQRCFECGQSYHLNPRNDIEGTDCGDAWIGPSLGLHFYCQPCIDRMTAEARAELGDSAGSSAELVMRELTGGSLPPPPPGPDAGRASPTQPPPRRARAAPRRRYRRIDGQ